MTQPEILTGPSARLILHEEGERWTCVVDAKSMTGPFATMSGRIGGSGGAPTRSDVLKGAIAWVRRFFGANLHPKQAAWLDGLTSAPPVQPDLFLQNAPPPADGPKGHTGVAPGGPHLPFSKPYEGSNEL